MFLQYMYFSFKIFIEYSKFMKKEIILIIVPESQV